MKVSSTLPLLSLLLYGDFASADASSNYTAQLLSSNTGKKSLISHKIATKC